MSGFEAMQGYMLQFDAATDDEVREWELNARYDLCDALRLAAYPYGMSHTEALDYMAGCMSSADLVVTPEMVEEIWRQRLKVVMTTKQKPA